MKNLTFYLKIAAVCLFTLSMTACDDGAEDVGESIDEAVTDAGNAVEDACEEVKEGVKAEDDDC